MKKLLTVLIALAAGGLLAQTTPPFESSLHTRIPSNQPDNPLGLQPGYEYEVHYHGLTMDGLSVELYQAKNPLNLFNPFDSEVRASAHDNITWDMETGQADGWNFFTLHF